MKSYVIISFTVFSALALFSACQEKENVPVLPLENFSQLHPLANAMNVDDRPLLQWDASSHSDSYSLTISAKADFSSVVFEKKDLIDTAFTLAEPLEEGRQYFWKVTAINAVGSIVSDNAGIAFRVKGEKPLSTPGKAKFYVSPDGEDNPDRGASSLPFRTVAYAASRMAADEGDTLFLKPGTYSETDPIIIPTGVNMIGSGEAQTLLSSSGVTLAAGINAGSSNFKLWYDGALIQLVSPNRTVVRDVHSKSIAPGNGNQVIKGFTVDGQNKSLKAGVWVENRDNVTMVNVTFKNLAQRGAVFAGGDKDFYIYPDYYLKGIRIHDCTFINSAKDLTDETLGNLCIAQLQGADIYNLTIQDNQGYGIKFIYDGYFKDCKIHDCTIQLNEYDTKWGEDIAVELWNLGPGNELYNLQCNTWLSVVNHPEIFGKPSGNENVHIHHVRLIDKDGASSKEAIEVGMPGVEIDNSYFENKGIGMAVWDMGRENISIHHNVFYNSQMKSNWASGAAVYIDNSHTWKFKNINIFNNVFDTHLITIRVKGTGIEGIQIRNNTFLNAITSEVDAQGSNITFTNNLKFKEGSSSWSVLGVTSQSDNYIGNPGYFYSGNRWENYYRPSASSSLGIDKGVNIGFPFQGAAPDIGAFEWN